MVAAEVGWGGWALIPVTARGSPRLVEKCCLYRKGAEDLELSIFTEIREGVGDRGVGGDWFPCLRGDSED